MLVIMSYEERPEGERRGTEFGRKQNESEESKKQTVSNKGNDK